MFFFHLVPAHNGMLVTSQGKHFFVEGERCKVLFCYYNDADYIIVNNMGLHI